ncbi:Aste57867_1020 [Aphanomyces stellatus]|uniref:Aste57867_1020 protein n=1 Tax=Aphanomyces stellatus TaxID=120398 RepID=A0A485K4G2_9STRA|nr:hypothetical protein As57867_001019 [Aphanomyces stellatus]VFT78242.1 Aste57867_1020 [Aphanomyces stellatus]
MQTWLARWLYGVDGVEKVRAVDYKAELVGLLKISTPSFLTALSACAISLVDYIVAGHLGTSELAAVAYSRMLLDLVIVVFSQGFCEGTNALCSQAFGAKNFDKLGRYFQLGSFCLVLVSVPIGGLSWNAGYILYRVGIPSTTAHLSDIYCRYCIIGLMPRLLLKNMQSYFQAQHIVVPAAVISVLFVGVDICIKVLLTFGTASWAGLGFIGIPLATSATYWLLLSTYTLYMCVLRRYHAPSWTWSWAFLDGTLLKELLALGLPMMGGQVFENAQLQICAVFVAMSGQAQLAAHNSMLELFLFVTSPIYGLMTGSTTRIAMYLGAGRPLLAKAVSHLTLVSIMSIAFCTCVALISTQRFLGTVFSKDPEVIMYIGQIATLGACGYILISFFYYSMVRTEYVSWKLKESQAVLNAQSRTLPVIIGFFVGAWVIGVPVAYLLGVRGGLGLIGVWIGMSLGYVITMSFGAYAVQTSDWEVEAQKAVARFEMKDQTKNDQQHLEPTNVAHVL